jgi:hypothetical protein
VDVVTPERNLILLAKDTKVNVRRGAWTARLSCRLVSKRGRSCATDWVSASRNGASEKAVPAMVVGILSLDLINKWFGNALNKSEHA